MSENRELTPKRAHELYTEEGLSNSQIGERYDVSESTVSRRRSTYREMQETAESTVTEAIEEYDFSDHIKDDEPEENPYETVKCPACNSDIPKPDTAGEHTCGECKTNLRFSEDEVK